MNAAQATAPVNMYFIREAAYAACEVARAAVNARADAQDSINPAFTACKGNRGTPIMDSSTFRATVAGECGGNLGWGDEIRAEILKAR
jgi:hypothetical protein